LVIQIASLTQKMGRIRQGSSLTAEEVVGGRQLHSKVAIVTGANSGLGYETARVLCKAGARVILACRSVQSAEAAADRIRKELAGAAALAVEIVHDSEWVGANYTDVGTVEVRELDLADLDSVRSCAGKFLEEECPLHYLICNAGKMAPPFRQTKQGYETQWAINHLGHFLLSSLLTEKLDETAGRTEEGTRLVVLTSQSHQLGQMHWDRGFLNYKEDYDP
jgi:NAD(P)-dependent dehydrogenase (short-subunit alcohol dehydrogenase family)